MTNESESVGPSATIDPVGLCAHPAVEQRIEHATNPLAGRDNWLARLRSSKRLNAP